MIGAELNAAIQEEWPAGATHTHRLRNLMLSRSPVLKRMVGSPSDRAKELDIATAEPPV
jgi:membrane protein